MAWHTIDKMKNSLNFLKISNRKVEKAMEGIERHSKSFDKRIKRILNAL